MSRTERDFIERLKEIVGDNATEFARKVGISQPLLFRYLTGDYAPGYDFFLILAKRGIDLNWLVAGQKTQEHEVRKAADKMALILTSLGPVEKQLLLATIPALADITEILAEPVKKGARRKS